MKRKLLGGLSWAKRELKGTNKARVARKKVFIVSRWLAQGSRTCERKVWELGWGGNYC
jgi:hypothetical protein